MTTINTTDDLLSAAREDTKFCDASRREIMGGIDARPEPVLTATEGNTQGIAETKKIIAENSKNIADLETTSQLNARHLDHMFVVQRVVREAALIANRMGLRYRRALERQEIIDILETGADKGLTQGISRDDKESFMKADLIVDAQTADGERRYIAVAISHTADDRETNRAVRNAEYITKFAAIPTYAVAAGMFKDNRIDEVLTTDTPQPYDSDRETLVFWSKHEDIDRAN